MSSIPELLKTIESDPSYRQSDIPIEAAQSYPFLGSCQQQLCLIVFYNRVMGPPDERSSYPPQWIAKISLESGKILEFRNLQRNDLAYEVLGYDDDDEPVYVRYGLSTMDYGDFVGKRDQLQKALQVLIPLFQNGSREQIPEAKIYLQRLKDLVPTPLRGYYFALGQPFFIWLMQTSDGVLLIDPPPGVSAVRPPEKHQ